MQEVYLIAGEPSGDNIGAKLMQALQLESGNQYHFKGVGGNAMMAEGLVSLFPISQISLFGFIEVLPHIFAINKLIDKVVADIIASKVRIVITIDSPGFNFQVARLLKANKHIVKLVHYVAPTVWAYKEKRAATCAKLYDCMLTLFPFEVAYFTKYNLATYCVGHPLFDYDYETISTTQFRQQYNIKPNTHLICITPGSRKGEITRHMPILLETIKNLSMKSTNFRVAIAAANLEIAALIKSYIDNDKIIIVTETADKLQLYKAADVAIAKSGTNILEISACATPVIVFYTLNIISWWLLKFMLKIKFATIVNIMADRAIIPEFLQTNFNPISLTKQTIIYLEDKQVAQQQVTQVQNILQDLGINSNVKASNKAAKIIIDLLQQPDRNL